ncbi:MAG TPA: 1-phosphofructokinase [Bacillales bacterium]|nr:1-phosphofructokinase [Bacillales bacterium]
MTDEKKAPILTITLNPAMDVFVHVNELQPGALHRTSEFQKSPGGKGINVAKALNTFGTPVVASGFLGGSNGNWIERQLNQQQIRTRFVDTSAETRMNIKVVEAEGQLTELNSSSPLLTSRDWEHFDHFLEQVPEESSWIALCGKLPENCPPNWYEKVINRCKKHGIQTAVDTSGTALKHAVRAKPDFIKPNWEELQELTGQDLSSKGEVAKAARKIAATGISTVAVSLGADGMIIAHKKETWDVQVPQMDVISPVGAGDSVVAGFLHGFYHEHSFTGTIRFAAACGAAAVTKEGTTHPERTDIEPLLSKIIIKKQEA